MPAVIASTDYAGGRRVAQLSPTNQRERHERIRGNHDSRTPREPEPRDICHSACSGLIKPEFVAEVVSQFLNLSPGSRHAFDLADSSG